MKRVTNKKQEPWLSLNFEGEFVLRPGFRPLQPGVFTNSLGMKFVPVPGTQLQMCIHETRRADYAAYAAANSGVDVPWKNARHGDEPVGQKADHPVVMVSWEDAQGFCAWLSQKESKTYRLPTDREWSMAVGIGDWGDATATLATLGIQNTEVYPWGGGFIASAIHGNYSGLEMGVAGDENTIPGYRDGFRTTAPVGSFTPNSLGIYDLGGNVSEWCRDWVNPEKQVWRVMRGGSWFDGDPVSCRSSNRSFERPGPGPRTPCDGFRVVLVVSGSGG